MLGYTHLKRERGPGLKIQGSLSSREGLAMQRPGSALAASWAPQTLIPDDCTGHPQPLFPPPPPGSFQRLEIRHLQRLRQRHLCGLSRHHPGYCGDGCKHLCRVGGRHAKAGRLLLRLLPQGHRWGAGWKSGWRSTQGRGAGSVGQVGKSKPGHSRCCQRFMPAHQPGRCRVCMRLLLLIMATSQFVGEVGGEGVPLQAPETGWLCFR